MKLEEQAIIVVIFGLFLYVTIADKVFAFIEVVKAFKDNSIQGLIHTGLDTWTFLTSLKGIIIMLLILSPFLLYLNYKLNNKMHYKFNERKERKQQLKLQIQAIESLLRRDIEKLDLVQAEELHYQLSARIGQTRKERKFKQFRKELTKKRDKLEDLIEILKKKQNLGEIEQEEKEAQKRVHELEKKAKHLAMKAKNKNWDILYELNAPRTDVYYKKDLNPEQIKVLLSFEFVSVNEYDIFEKKTVPVLVKKVMNHSSSHTFLVWSTKKYLRSVGIEQIKKSDTRYPDITFYHNDVWWAIEIECGSLLRKKDQLRAKLEFLYKNYDWRWFFLVSNKNRLPEYRKHGPAIPRSQVAKYIKKWLKTTI